MLIQNFLLLRDKLDGVLKMDILVATNHVFYLPFRKNILILLCYYLRKDYIKLGFLPGGSLGHFVGGRWLFFFFDEVKIKHFVFFREF